MVLCKDDSTFVLGVHGLQCHLVDGDGSLQLEAERFDSRVTHGHNGKPCLGVSPQIAEVFGHVVIRRSLHNLAFAGRDAKGVGDKDKDKLDDVFCFNNRQQVLECNASPSGRVKRATLCNLCW